LNLYGSTGILC